MPVRAVSMIGDGYIPILPTERSAAFLAIYCSVLKTEGDDYRNFRYPMQKGFYGYYQLFDDQAAIKTGPIEFRSQLIWKYRDDLQYTFTRFCELGAYIRSLNTGLKTGLSGSLGGFGVSIGTAFPDAFPEPNYFLITENPSSIAFRLEPNAVGEMFISSENLISNPCAPEIAPPIEPGGCGGSGNPPTEIPPGCLPTPPGGGS